MSDQTAKVAANLRAFRMGINGHDRNHPEPHPAAYGIGLSVHDMERLGFDDGEQLWGGITIHADEGVSGNFRVLCGAEHDQSGVTRTEAIGRHVPVGG